MRRFLAITLGTMAGYGTSTFLAALFERAIYSGTLPSISNLLIFIGIAAFILSVGIFAACLTARLVTEDFAEVTWTLSGTFGIVSFLGFCFLNYFFPKWLTVAGDFPFITLLAVCAALNSIHLSPE